MRLEWDEQKDRQNQRKHGLSFQQAAELFRGDADYLEVFDAAHSEHEDRFLAIGPIATGLIVVVWTEREDGSARIISARRATTKETKLYHARMEGRGE